MTRRALRIEGETGTVEFRTGTHSISGRESCSGSNGAGNLHSENALLQNPPAHRMRFEGSRLCSELRRSRSPFSHGIPIALFLSTPWPFPSTLGRWCETRSEG